jgi:Uma2 family endonuclease
MAAGTLAVFGRWGSAGAAARAWEQTMSTQTPFTPSQVGFIPPQSPSNQTGRPTWEIAHFFPDQGEWTEKDYLDLERIFGDHIRVELVDGRLEMLPAPTEQHQDSILFLLDSLRDFVVPRRLGKVSFSGIRVRIRQDPNPKFREPDVAFMKRENAHRRSNEFWDGADLVMEIVSGDENDRKRDYEEKPEDYAEARVGEYWIIDPEERRIRVLVLDGDKYRIHGDFGPGQVADSVLLPGFKVNVDDVFAAGAV